MNEMKKSHNTKKCLTIISIVGIVSFLWFFIINFIGAIAISGLPRSMQGESVSIPWPICALTLFVLELLPITLLAIILTKGKWFKVLVVASIVIMFFVVNYGLGGVELLDKAWRRGL